MFKDIHKEVEKLSQQRTVQTAAPAVSGIMVSKPGTEKVVLATSVADFVMFTAVGTTGKDKIRYGVAHKDKTIKYTGQYTDSNGHPLSIVPKSVFDTTIAIINSMNKQLQDMKRELEQTNMQAESYKMTLDALRKNGVID